jgi:hypothetical protein
MNEPRMPEPLLRQLELARELLKRSGDFTGHTSSPVDLT